LIDIIEHMGPSVTDLIASRLRTNILTQEFPNLKLRTGDDGRSDGAIGQAEIKQWIDGWSQANQLRRYLLKEFVDTACEVRLWLLRKSAVRQPFRDPVGAFGTMM
jgi:hypothetical protein